VVYGHPFETIDAERKEAEVVRFFSPGATSEERQELLDRYGVRYVLGLPAETGLDRSALDLTPVWTDGEVTLYRVGTDP
jgi:hypothetical protein